MLLAMLMLGSLAMAEPAIPAEVGAEAPDFEIKMTDGEIFRLSDHRGKVVFLNIWATWCGPCVSEMPDIEKLANAYPEELVVIGVSCDDDAYDVVKFIQANGYTYNIAVDKTMEVSGMLYPSYAIPNSIFIDPNGVVTSIEAGAASYEVLEGRFLEAKANAEEVPAA